MTSKKAVKKTKKSAAAARKNNDVFTVMVHEKKLLRVLAVYDKADDLQRLRLFAMLSDWISRETIAILDRAEAPKPAAGGKVE